MLQEVLTQITGMAVEEEDMPKKQQLQWEWFMTEFPQVRRDLEAHIRELHTLADKVDKVHKNCTISKVVASSTGVVSGILTIVGLSLAPVTAGASLVLSTTGIGLGAAATVTSVSTSIVDYSNSSAAKAKASHLLSTRSNKEEVIVEAARHSTFKIASLTNKCIQSVQDIVKNVKAIKMAKTSPLLLSEAQRVMTTGTMSVRSSSQVQKAFGGTVLAMSKGAKIAGAAMAGVGLLMDAISLVKQSKYLHKGTKAASAEKLRQEAQKLEKKLKLLTTIYEHLQNI